MSPELSSRVWDPYFLFLNCHGICQPRGFDVLPAPQVSALCSEGEFQPDRPAPQRRGARCLGLVHPFYRASLGPAQLSFGLGPWSSVTRNRERRSGFWKRPKLPETFLSVTPLERERFRLLSDVFLSVAHGVTRLDLEIRCPVVSRVTAHDLILLATSSCIKWGKCSSPRRVVRIK